MPFTAQELGDLTKCLTSAAAVRPTRRRLATRCSRIRSRTRIRLLACGHSAPVPAGPSHCPTIGNANAGNFNTLVRSAGASLRRKTPRSHRAFNAPHLLPTRIVSVACQLDIVPSHRLGHRGRGYPFGVFIDESAPRLPGSTTCAGALSSGPEQTPRPRQRSLKRRWRRAVSPPPFLGTENSSSMTGTTTFPMALSHAFVFGDAGTADTVSRFAAGLNSCVQLYATPTAVDLNPDQFRTLMAACRALQRAQSASASRSSIRTSVLGASGTCNTATSGRRMFMAKLHPDGRITFPADCISNVRYLLVSGRDLSQWPSDADAPLVVVQGAYETLGKSSCTVGGLAAASSRPSRTWSRCRSL